MVPSVICSPEISVNSELNSGSAKKTLPSKRRLSVMLASQVTSTPMVLAVSPLIMPRSHHLSSTPPALSIWMSSQIM